MAKSTLLSALAVFSGIACAKPFNRRTGHLIQLRQNNTAPPPGYHHQLFLDDFSAGFLDTNTWQYDLGTSYPGGPENWGTGETQTYTRNPSNIRVNAEGNLVITPQTNGSHWTSSRIETTANVDFSAPEGGKLWVEANIKVGSPNMPPGVEMGIWPAFWMLGSDFRNDYWSWPAIGEIDILETINGDSTVYHTVHCDVAPGGVCNEFDGIGSSSEFTRGEWHRFAAEIDRSNPDWTQQSLNYYIDRQLSWSIGPSQLEYSESVWQALAASSKIILLNVAVGGGLPSGVSGETTPNADTLGGEDVDMEIEYVAAWST